MPGRQQTRFEIIQRTKGCLGLNIFAFLFDFWSWTRQKTLRLVFPSHFLIDFNPLENIVIKKLSLPAFCRFLSGLFAITRSFRRDRVSTRVAEGQPLFGESLFAESRDLIYEKFPVSAKIKDSTKNLVSCRISSLLQLLPVLFFFFNEISFLGKISERTFWI